MAVPGGEGGAESAAGALQPPARWRSRGSLPALQNQAGVRRGPSLGSVDSLASRWAKAAMLCEPWHRKETR